MEVRKMRKTAIAVLTIALCLAVIGGLAWGISPPPKSAPVPPTSLINPVEALLRSAHVEEPWQWEGLTVFPVVLKPVRSFGDALTLDEALAKGVLSISEIGHGQVNRVIAHNRSDRHIYLMAGEALGGAKQDRMVAEDVLLPPHGRLEIAVWCVEHGRWTEGKEFRSGGFIAPALVRRKAAQTSQTDVWEGVAEAQRAAGAPAGSLATVAKSKAVQEKMRPYRDRLLSLPDRREGTCGVIVAYGRDGFGSAHHTWLAADIFYEPALFERLWPKLLDSYLMEVSSRSPRWEKPSVRDAEDFLGQLFWARHFSRPTPGAGRRVELRGDSIYGSALVMGPSVIHLEAFPGAHILREDRPRPLPPSLQYRRNRLSY